MLIFIRGLSGVVTPIHVSPQEKVLSVKTRLFYLKAIPITDQHLLYMGRELGNHLILASVGISHGALLNLVLSIRTGPLSKPLACLPCHPHSFVARQPILQRIVQGSTTTSTTMTNAPAGISFANGQLPVAFPFLCATTNAHPVENSSLQQQEHSSTCLEPNSNDDMNMMDSVGSGAADNSDDEMNQIAEYLGYAIHDSERVESLIYGNQVISETDNFPDCFYEVSESGDSMSNSEFVDPSTTTGTDNEYDVEHDSMQRISPSLQILSEESPELHENPLAQLEDPTQECPVSLIPSCASSDPKAPALETPNTNNSPSSSLVPSQSNSSTILPNLPKYPNAAFILNPFLTMTPEIWRYQPILLPGGLTQSSTDKLHQGWYPTLIVGPQLPLVSRIPTQSGSVDSGIATSQPTTSFPLYYPHWDSNNRLTFLSMWNNPLGHSKPEHIAPNRPNLVEDKKPYSNSNESPDDDESNNLNYSKRSSRCSECNKRTRPACGFSCRCKRWFCSKHHHPEDHKCDFNFKAMTNPMLITIPSQLPP